MFWNYSCCSIQCPRSVLSCMLYPTYVPVTSPAGFSEFGQQAWQPWLDPGAREKAMAQKKVVAVRVLPGFLASTLEIASAPHCGGRRNITAERSRPPRAAAVHPAHPRGRGFARRSATWHAIPRRTSSFSKKSARPARMTCCGVKGRFWQRPCGASSMLQYRQPRCCISYRPGPRLLSPQGRLRMHLEVPIPSTACNGRLRKPSWITNASLPRAPEESFRCRSVPCGKTRALSINLASCWLSILSWGLYPNDARTR